MVYQLWFFIFELMIGVVGAYYRSTVVGYTIVSVSDANVQLTQYDASNWCRANGTQLLEIPNADTQDVVAQFLKGAFKDGLVNGWSTLTNAKRDGRGWQWINGPSIGGGIIIEKQGPDLSTSFGFLQNAGTKILIAASLPTDRRGYICEGPYYCSGGESFSSRCYRSYVDASVDWFDARNRCLDGGGDLASFDFIVDSQGLTLLNRTWISSTYTYWIGIRRIFWKWQNANFEAKYTQWDNEQPAYNPTFECVCLTPYEWNWSPCDCSQRYQFICLSATNASSTSGSPSTRTSTTTTSTTSTSTTTTTTTTATKTTTTASTTTTTTTTAKPSLATEKSSTQNTNYNQWTTLASSSTTTNHNQWTTLASSSSTTTTTTADVDSNPPQESSNFSHPTYDQGLGIGLGVGIAGGLIISAIIVCCYIRARRRGWSGTFSLEKVPDYSTTTNHHHRPNEATSSYALIQRKSSSQLSRQSSSTADSALNIIYAYPQLQLQQQQPNSSHCDNNAALPPSMTGGRPDQSQKKRKSKSLNTDAVQF